MSWSAGRKRAFWLKLFSLAVVVAVLVIYRPFGGEPESCFDGVKNGLETGIDCGGNCDAVCTDDYGYATILWTVANKIDDGLYSVTTLIENQNSGKYAENFQYAIRMYDVGGVELYGDDEYRTSMIYPRRFTVIRDMLRVDGDVADVALDYKKGNMKWFRYRGNIDDEIRVLYGKLEGEGFKNSLDAELENRTVKSYEDLGVYALIFDEKENLIASSESLVEMLGPNEKKAITFTWPKYFEVDDTLRFEVYAQPSDLKI